MGINKEKLLKELPCIADHCIEYQCKHHRSRETLTMSECIGEVIKNFPEEPEQPIDFDALWDEYKKLCNGMPCDFCKFDKKGGTSDICFYNFLKSKNLTHTKLFEIPVKRTGILKSPDEILKGSQYIEFKGCGYSLSSDDKKIGQRDEVIFPDYCYSEIKEEPDYSRLKGSIVECVTKTVGTIHDKIDRSTESQVWFNRYSNIAISNIVSIRVVELAKE